jgi:hypothetical protein
LVSNSHNIDKSSVDKLLNSDTQIGSSKDKLIKYQLVDSANFSNEAKSEQYSSSMRQKEIEKELSELSDDRVFSVNKESKFVEKQGFVDNKTVFAFNKEKTFEQKKLDEVENASFDNLVDYTDVANSDVFAVFDKEKFLEKAGTIDDRDTFAIFKEPTLEEKQLDDIENASYNNLVDYTDVANSEAFAVFDTQKVTQKQGAYDDKDIFRFIERLSYEDKRLEEAYTSSFKSQIDYTDVANSDVFAVFDKEKFLEKAGTIDDRDTFAVVRQEKFETAQLNELLELSFSNEKNIYDLANDDTFVVIEDSNKLAKAGTLSDKAIFDFTPSLKQETKELNNLLNLSFSNEKNMYDLASDDTFVVIEDSDKLAKAGTLNDKAIFDFTPSLKLETKELNNLLNLSFSNEKNSYDSAKDNTFEVVKEKKVTPKSGTLSDKDIFDNTQQEQLLQAKLYDSVLKVDTQNIEQDKKKLQVDEQNKKSLQVDSINKEKTLDAFDEVDESSATGKIDKDEVFNASNEKSFEQIAKESDTKSVMNFDMQNQKDTKNLTKSVDEYLKEINGVDCPRCEYLESIGFYDSPDRARLILLQAISTANTPMLERISQMVTASQVKKR